MNKDELVTIKDLDEKERIYKNYLLAQFEEIKKQITELNKPYIFWAENLSMKQAREYTGRSKSTILKWVKEELLKQYTIGASTNVYYSKTELDTIKPRWEAIRRAKDLKMAV